MKAAISNIAWTAEKDTEIYGIMKKYGFDGLEIAPTRIFADNPYDDNDRAKRWIEKLGNDYGFVVPSMQSIWYGRQEKLFGSEEEREALTEYTKKAIEFAETVGCHNLVFGCPRNRIIPDGANQDIAINFFAEIAEYAELHNTVVSMEANPPIYNTNYINTTIEAIHLVERINKKGFKVNLDVGTMIENDEPVSILEGKADLINHVHISEPGLILVEKRDIHQELISLLKNENYNGFISIEMGNKVTTNNIDATCSYVKELIE